jgi:hypothetical protein
MRQIVYAMRFAGLATPIGPAGHLFKMATTAPGCTFMSTVGPAGDAGRIRRAEGGEATLESEVTFTGVTSFQAVGTIAFGDGHRLRFGTIGSGYLDASPDPTRKHGIVMWRVDGGEGQFAGASGLIASTFFVGDGGEVTDYHVGVIFLR